MKQIDLTKTNGQMKKHLEKAMVYQNYRNAMVKSFNIKENFDKMESAGIDGIRKSFLITGKGCKFLTAEEYADLAVKTWEEVKKAKMFPNETQA